MQDDDSVFLKRRSFSSTCSTQQPPEKRIVRELIINDSALTFKDGRGKECVLRVPNAIKLDEPNGLVLSAVDGCAMNVPPIPNFWKTFCESFDPAKNPDLEFCLRLFSRSSPVVNLDNPGHVLLAIRGLVGDDICKAHTAYIKALAICTCPPEMREKQEVLMEPSRLLWFHAGICKMLGACYYAAPLPPKAYPTTDHMTIFMDILKKAIEPTLNGQSPITDKEKVIIMHGLRSWHCPKYVRMVCPEEAKRWSFDRARERAEAIVLSLKTTPHS